MTATETEIVSNDIQDGDRIIVGKIGVGATKTSSGNRGGGMGGPGAGGPMR